MTNPAINTPTAILAVTAVTSTSTSAGGTRLSSKRNSSHTAANITTAKAVCASARPAASAARMSVRGVSDVQAIPSVPMCRSLESPIATDCMVVAIQTMTTVPMVANAR